MADRSRANIRRIAQLIGEDTGRFGELMKIFFAGPYRVTHFSAHVIEACCRIHPGLIAPYIGQMLDQLALDVHDSLKRNVVRTLQFVDLPERHWDQAVEGCFRLLQNKQAAVAIRVFAMTVLAQLATKLPDIKNELRPIIEDELPYQSPAFVSRGRKVLKMLNK